MLVDTFTVLENVVLGTESGISLKESLRASEIELKRLEKEYHLEVDINATINTLPVGLSCRLVYCIALYKYCAAGGIPVSCGAVVEYIDPPLSK